MVLLVQSRACATCIFKRANAAVLSRLLAQIADPRMKGHFQGHRVCHHSKEAVCRGFWNRFKDHFDLGQIAQRLGAVQFVNHDVLEKCCSPGRSAAESSARGSKSKPKKGDS